MAELSPVPFDPFGTAGKQINLLSGILGLKQQQAETQKAQQAMQERLGIQKMMQTGLDDQGNSIRNDNGEPDPARILPALGRIAPLTGQEYAQSVLETHANKVALQAASTSLDEKQRNMISGLAEAAINDP